MEHLWAPWRNRYVTTPPENRDELFAQLGQSTNDRENGVYARSKAAFAVLNRYPYNAGHTLVVPYRAVEDLGGLSDQESADLWKLVQKVTEALKTEFAPHGFNIGINIGESAGAGIPKHLHVHVVPRWSSDANFMTSTAETRVHPNELEAIFDKLSPHFQ
jgi:ATP adenylyltransferase